MVGNTSLCSRAPISSAIWPGYRHHQFGLYARAREGKGNGQQPAVPGRRLVVEGRHHPGSSGDGLAVRSLRALALATSMLALCSCAARKRLAMRLANFPGLPKEPKTITALSKAVASRRFTVWPNSRSKQPVLRLSRIGASTPASLPLCPIKEE
jgi:hypothetical protein